MSVLYLGGQTQSRAGSALSSSLFEIVSECIVCARAGCGPSKTATFENPLLPVAEWHNLMISPTPPLFNTVMESKESAIYNLHVICCLILCEIQLHSTNCSQAPTPSLSLSLCLFLSFSLSLFLSPLFLHISESLNPEKVASWLPILSEVDVILM